MSRLLILIFTIVLVPFWASALSWKEVQRLPEFKDATLNISGHQPELAVLKLRVLLNNNKLEKTAKEQLTAMLGQAQVRAGQANDALLNLKAKDSNSMTWRALALTQLGKLKEAQSTWAQIKGPESLKQQALLSSALGDSQKAKTLLSPLLTSDTGAGLISCSIHLDLGEVDAATQLHAKLKPDGAEEELAYRFLEGRIALALEDRNRAVGTFQSILSGETEQFVSSEFFNASILALADSYALDGKMDEAATFLLESLERRPNSPNLDEIYSRLRQWRTQVPLEPLIRWTTTIPSPSYQGPLFRETSLSPRDAYALHLLSLIESEKPQPNRSSFLFKRLFLETPENLNVLIDQSLIDLGLLHLKSGKADLALHTFETSLSRAKTGNSRALSNALKGAASFALQDPKQAEAAFKEASELASKNGASQLALKTSLNAGLVTLQINPNPSLSKLPAPTKDALTLERGLLLSSKNDIQSREILENFLIRHATHPRLDEAALALAENCVFASPVNPTLAEKYLTVITFDPEKRPKLAARKIECLLALNQGFELAQQFLTKLPTHPSSASLLFQQGLALSRSDEEGKEAKAFFSFEKLLETFPESQFAEVTRMLSARSAISVGSPAAEERAFERYGEIIKGGGSLAVEAAIELGRHRLERNQPELVLKEISPFLKEKGLSSADLRRFLVLAGEAARQKADPELALSYFEKLLKLKDLPVAWFNRACYLQGQVLEDLSRPAEALDSYMTVANKNYSPDELTPLEWKWHDTCVREGALPLLERYKKWHAAYTLLQRVAESGGPSAGRAAERANQIKLDHMLFE